MLTVKGETLVKEGFGSPSIFAFQNFFASNNVYSVVKDGALETRGINSFFDPNEGISAPLFRKAFSAGFKKIVRARAYIAGLGYYTCWLNG